MRLDCEQAIEDALGRPLKKGESQRLEDAIKKHMRLLARQDTEGWRSLSNSERMDMAAKAAVDEQTADAEWRQRNVEMQILAHERIANTLADAFSKLPGKKAGEMLNVVSQLAAMDVKAKGMPPSVESWAHGIKAEAFGKLVTVFDAAHGKFFSLLSDPEGIKAIEMELHGEDSGNPAAKEGVKAWKEVTTELKERANTAGQRIGTLAGWGRPQNHSQSLIAKAGLEQWSADTLPKLDRSMYLHEDGQYMDDAHLMSHVLPAAYDSIVTDGMSEESLGQNRKGSVANRNAEHRSIFFKDAQSSMEYQAKYGQRDLLSSMVAHVAKLSRDIALMEKLGPNSNETFQYFNDRAKLDELRQFPEKAAKINKEHVFNQSLFDYVSGKQKVVDQRVADAFQAYRNYNVATKLGSVVITAIGDEAGIAATAFANKIPWSAVLQREMKYLDPTNPIHRDIASRAGLGLNGMLGEVNRFGGEELTGGTDSTAGKANAATSKLATMVMKLSGAEPLWDARRRGLGSILMNFVGDKTRTLDFKDLNEADHGVLARKGVTENDWQVWKRATPENWEGNAQNVMTPKAIWAIPDEQLKDLGDPTALKRNASTILMSHVLEEIGMGVMDTGARERTTMTFGKTKGTYSGELIQSTMLFKGFAASMMMKHWGRMSTMEGAGAWKYGATLGVIGTVTAAAAMQLRALASGKNPENMADPRFWMSATLRGGGMGFYGDFLYNEINSHDSSLAAGLIGPVATDLESLSHLTLGAAIKAGKGERTDEGANLIRYARGNIPLLNMWYTKAAMDHYVWNNIQEAASPGYLDRMMGRAYNDKGTTYYWDPHEKLPSAIDVKQAWNPDAGAESAGNWLAKVTR